jgi:hypothetical protein
LTGNFTAQLVAMSLANGAILANPTDLQFPFTSGSVVVTSQVATVTLNGTQSNRTFNVFQCPLATSVTCVFLATVGSDLNGTAVISTPVNPSGGGSIFEMIQTTQTAGGFLSGFTVP